MAIPTTGPLSLYATIGVELGVAQSNVSLGTMSNTAGFTDPDAMSEFYGYSSGTAPSVTTNTISNISETTLTINGNITSDGGATITERGFYFGTNSSSPTSNAKYTVGGTTGYYSNNRSGLSASTTYYCWAFATNSVGTTFGARVQANTIQAFTPTWTLSTTGYDYSATNFYACDYGCGGFKTNPAMYYLNPYTSSWVLYAYNSFRVECSNLNSWSMSTQMTNTAGRANFQYCNNARNRAEVYIEAENGSGISNGSPTQEVWFRLASSGRTVSNNLGGFQDLSGTTYIRYNWTITTTSCPGYGSFNLEFNLP